MNPSDESWFAANPDRAFRLRRQTPAETKRARVRPGLTPYVAIRRVDGATELLAFSEVDGWPDDDTAISLLFNRILRRAA